MLKNEIDHVCYVHLLESSDLQQLLYKIIIFLQTYIGFSFFKTTVEFVLFRCLFSTSRRHHININLFKLFSLGTLIIGSKF